MDTRGHNLSGLVSELRAQSERVDAMLRGATPLCTSGGTDDGDDVRTCGAETTVVLTGDQAGEPQADFDASGSDAPHVRWFSDVGQPEATPPPFFFNWTGGDSIGESDVEPDSSDITATPANDDSSSEPSAQDASPGQASVSADPIPDAPADTPPTGSASPASPRHVSEASRAHAPADVNRQRAPSSHARPIRPPLQPFAMSSDAAPPSGEPLEVRIGQRWMAWIGTITVLVAIAILTRLALEEAWFGSFSRVACTALAL
ncbi:MAG: hypothetical protein D6744_02730, partial [Planctomycetota bacterium]